MTRISMALLLFCTCFGSVAWPQAVEERGSSGDPDALGLYAIGHTSYMFIDTTRANRPVYSDVWYPVDAKKITSSAIPAQYALDPFSANLPISTSKDWEILGYDPAYEGPAPSHGGPFPLLVFSPGFDDDSWQQLFIGTRLASHGYVVAVLDHYADCQWSWSPCDDLMTIAVNRPHDASFAITQLLLKGETPGVLLFGSIDSRRIAMGGHSWGGYATYALTGGDDLVCDALWPAIVGDETLPYPPSTCVPVIPDRRIRAMVSLDGSSQMMRYEEFSRISKPSLIMGETVEQLVQMGTLSGMPNPEQLRTYLARPHAAIDRSDSYRVDVDGANHYSFTNYCDGAQVFFNLGLISSDDLTAWLTSWPCANTGLAAVTISSADGHEAVDRYMIAFLDSYFRNPADNHWLDRWILTPEYALNHTPTVQFFDKEVCHASLPNDTYFTYRPQQTSTECDVAQKDPTGWFARDPQSSNSNLLLQTPAAGVRGLRPSKPF